MIETSKILYCKWCTGTLYFALWLWCFTELTVKRVARPPSLVNFIALPFQSNPNNAFLIFFSISCLPYLSLASDSNHFFPAKCANNTSSPIMHDSEFQLTVFFSYLSNCFQTWMVKDWIVELWRSQNESWGYFAQGYLGSSAPCMWLKSLTWRK